jgi:hypothetical protein
MTIYQAIVLIMIVLQWTASTYKIWTTPGTAGVNFTVQVLDTAWWGGLIALLHAGNFW